MGLLEKALHVKENEREQIDGDFSASAGISSDLMDLPDLSGLELPGEGELFHDDGAPSLSDSSASGNSDLTFVDIPGLESPLSGVPETLTENTLTSEDGVPANEASSTVESTSVLGELDDLELSEPVVDISEAESEELVLSDEATAELDNEIPDISETYPSEEATPADASPVDTMDPVQVSDFQDTPDMPKLMISDDDLIPESDSMNGGAVNSPAFTLSDDAETMAIPDEAAPSEAAVSPTGNFPHIHDDLSDEAVPSKEVPSSVSDNERSAVLWDAAREIVKSSSSSDLFNVLILLMMGYLESSTASVIVPLKGDEQNKWVLRESRGTRIGSKTITFKTADRIMNEIMTSPGIVDIEKFGDDLSCRAEYSLFLSIDARLAVPFCNDGQTLAVLVLGEKLSGTPYSPSDISFAADLCGLSSSVYARVVQAERLTEENVSLLRKGVEESDTESFEKKFCMSGDDAEIAVLIQERLRLYGIDSYAFFTRTEQGESFYPKFTEAEDLVTLRSSAFRIASTSEFCEYLLHADEWEEWENPGTSDIVRKLFGDNLILKMNIFIAQPFVIKGHLAGFMLVLRARRDVLSSNTQYAPLFCRMVSRYVLSCESVYVDDARFVDSVSRVFRRLERVIDYASQLRIPVAAVVFSVRNIKRYCALYGVAEGEDLIRRFRSVIESRISSSEFAVRTDRGKILVLLPGKNKKYAVPFANAVRNELTSTYRERESQIMLTFMTGEYPADGKNIYELIDYLD